MSNNIGSRIRAHRQRLAMSQESLSRLANIPQGDLSRIERGMDYCGATRRERIRQALRLDACEM